MPKRHGKLWYERIATRPNVELAFDKIIPPIDPNNPRKLTKPEQELLDNRETIIDSILQELQERTYDFGKVRRFKFKEGRKTRLIQYLPKRGTIILQCVQNVVQPIFMEKYIPETYSSIKGRGLSNMKDYIIQASLDNPELDRVITLDAAKCYDSVIHSTLHDAIAHCIKDIYVLEFYDRMMALIPIGLAIGFLPNHYLVNLLFSAMDHAMKEFEHCKVYCRYMDDQLHLCRDEDIVRILKAVQREFDKVGMHIKPNLRIDYLKNGIDFCGIVFYPNGHTMLRKSIKESMKRKDRKLRSMPNLTPEYYKAQMASYYGWCKWVDGYHLMHKVFGEYYDLFVKPKKKKRKMEAVRLADVKPTYFGLDHDRFISSYIENDRRLYENDFTVIETETRQFDGEEGIVVHFLMNDEHYYTITKGVLVERFKKAMERTQGKPFITRLVLQTSRTNPRRKYAVLK